jgi:hypothetical protein
LQEFCHGSTSTFWFGMCDQTTMVQFSRYVKDSIFMLSCQAQVFSNTKGYPNRSRF